jgi:hypothetical protein
VAGDFTVEEYLGLQRVVHSVAEAVREEAGAEQQFAAVMLETAGALKIPDGEKVALAARIGHSMQRP